MDAINTHIYILRKIVQQIKKFKWPHFLQNWQNLNKKKISAIVCFDKVSFITMTDCFISFFIYDKDASKNRICWIHWCNAELSKFITIHQKNEFSLPNHKMMILSVYFNLLCMCILIKSIIRYIIGKYFSHFPFGISCKFKAHTYFMNKLF